MDFHGKYRRAEIEKIKEKNEKMSVKKTTLVIQLKRTRTHTHQPCGK